MMKNNIYYVNSNIYFFMIILYKVNSMDDLAIVVFSCDKNEELWPIFLHFLDKNWPDHPKTYLFTESIFSPLISTITHPCKIKHWTRRIRKSLMDIKENKVIFICDDCFLNKTVNVDKLKRCYEILDKDNVASINFEISFDPNDASCEYEGFKKKTNKSRIVLSLLCGIWNKEALIDLLSIRDCDPWEVETRQEYKEYEYYQVCDDKILSWFRDGPYQCAAIFRGKWSKEAVNFINNEGLVVDFEKKGFN